MMKAKNFWISAALSALVLQGSAAPVARAQTAATQDKAQPERGRDLVIQERNVIVTTQDPVTVRTSPTLPTTVVPGRAGDTFVFVSSEMSYDKIVKGAPYSAEGTTETIQTLGDGNRIVRKNTTRIYRDSEGRTRREQTLGTIGPFASAGDPPQMIHINDPNTGIVYFLDPRDRTARKLVLPRFHATWNLPQGQVDKPVTTVYPAAAIAAGVEGKVRVMLNVNEAGKVEGVKVVEGHPLLQQAAVDAAKQITLKPVGRAGAPVKVQRELLFDFKRMAHNSDVPVYGAGAIQGATFQAASNATKESLGKQVIEGVEAEGTRSTMTIAPGEVGNEQPINIVSERWYSPELQVVVMTRHADPRFGETVYRLTNISRTEPARALFEVPSDYTIKESQVRTMVRTRKPSDEK